MNPDGAQIIGQILDEYETPNLILPCTIRGWEYQAIDFWIVDQS
jgi:hypothetical protein